MTIDLQRIVELGKKFDDGETNATEMLDLDCLCRLHGPALAAKQLRIIELCDAAEPSANQQLLNFVGKVREEVGR